MVFYLIVIQKFCEDIFSKVQEESDNNSNVIQLKEYFQILQNFKDVFRDPRFREYIESTYQNVRKFLKSLITKIFDDMRGIINDISENKTKLNSLLMRKLSKGLRFIQHEQWIRSIINGFVTTNVETLKDTILSYLINQRDIFVQMDLELGNHTRLMEAVTFMNDISKLRGVESLGSDLTEIFKDIDDHFVNAIDKVFNMSEKDSDLFEELERTNDILNYLTPFKDVFEIKRFLKSFKLTKDYVLESENCYKRIKKVLEEHFKTIDHIVIDNFEKLRKEDYVEEEVSKSCSIIIENMMKFKKISTLDKVSKIKFHNKSYNEWIKIYDNFFADISIKFISISNPQYRFLLLKICKDLSVLDSDISKTSIFGKLYEEQRQKFVTGRQVTVDEAKNFIIPNHDFELLKEHFESLKTTGMDPILQNLLNEKKRDIQDALNREISEIRKNLFKDLEQYRKTFLKDTSKIKSIYENFYLLKIAHQDLDSYIRIRNSEEKPENIHKTIENTFLDSIKRLKQEVENGFSNRRYERTEETISNVIENMDLSKFGIQDKVENLKDHINIERNKSINILLEDLNKTKFSQWEYDNVIDYYSILVKCSELMDSNNSNAEINHFYEGKKQLFFITLKKKIEDKLKELYSKSNRSQIELESISEMKKKFPPQLQSFFDYSSLNQQLASDKLKFIDQTKTSIEENLKNKNFSSMTKLLNDIDDNEYPDLKKEVEENISKKVKNFTDDLKTCLENKSPTDFVSSSKNMNNFMSSLNQLNDIKIKGKFSNIVNSEIPKIYKDHIQKPLDSTCTFLTSDEKKAIITENSQIEFIKFFKSLLKEKKDLVFFTSFDEDIKDFFFKIKQKLSEDQKKFSDFCQTMKIESSKEAKNIVKSRQTCEKVLLEVFSEETFENLKDYREFDEIKSAVRNLKIKAKDLTNELLEKTVELQQKFSGLNLNELIKKENAYRKKEYEVMRNSLVFLESLVDFKEFENKFEVVHSDTLSIFSQKIDLHYEEVDVKYVKKDKKKFKETEFIDLNKNMENFSLIAQEFSKFGDFSKKCHKKNLNIKKEIVDEIEKTKEEALKSDKIEEVLFAVVCLQGFKEYVHQVDDFNQVNEVLQNFKKKGQENFRKLGNLMQENPIGKIIISENKLFKGQNLSIFNQKLQRYGIDTIIEGDESSKVDGISGDLLENDDKKKLKKRYEEEFEPEYKRLVELYLKPKESGGINLAALKNELDLEIKKINKGGILDSIRNWFKSSKTYELPKILAIIFAYWTLMNAQDFYEISEEGCTDNSKKQYLMQPHPAQVVSILRMLCCGDHDEKIKNNLVQIGTGEGKSVTLAMTATVLALIGYSIDCACYSGYLSQRDYDDFKEFFIGLGVSEYIEYGTFSFLCEKNINADINIRDEILKFIGVSDQEKKGERRKNQEKRPKVLLLDEVDVFFSRDFYGASYYPTAVAKDPIITSLFKIIWTQRNNIKFSEAVNSQEFKDCISKFPKFSNLLREALKDMIAAAKGELPQNYQVINDTVAYKEQDSLSTAINYGYVTTFTYFLLYEKGEITKESLERHTGILINAGSFSYAEIPKNSYDYIFGVTGTLKTLGNQQQKILRESYNIQKETYMPSVYGKNNRKFNKFEDVFVENDLDFSQKIVKEVEKNLNQGKRCVLVFFRDEKDLNKFCEATCAQNLDAKIMTEKADMNEKKAFVATATLPNSVSLMPRCFGRGTDFKCRDTSVIQAGGVHVIQTFLSEDISEEIQIQGRCARQGDDGSYSLVLLKSELEAFLIVEMPENRNNWYDFLNEKRIKFFDAKNLDLDQHIKRCDEEHKKAMEFKNKLLDSAKNQKEIENFLISMNRGVECEVSVVSRTLCLMDSTGSMGNLLDAGKQTVSLVIQRAKEVLTDDKRNPDCFEFAIAFYTNYSSGPTKILRTSPWVKKVDELMVFLKNNGLDGGQGREAIEIGLWFANQEFDKAPTIPLQVMVIGDAAPNTLDEVRSRRKAYDASYNWKNTPFCQEVYYETELDKLKQKNVKVFTFYVANGAKEAFTKMTTEANGCSYLDINNAAKGSQELLDTLAKVILNGVGGDKLTENYDKKYNPKKLNL